MKQWTTIPAVRRILEKKWNSGLFLRHLVQPQQLFPLSIPLRGPTTAQLGDDFDEARRWVAQFIGNGTNRHWQVRWKMVNHRVRGANELPVAVVFATPGDLFGFLGKTREAERFRELSATVLTHFPQLVDWVARKPLSLLDYGVDVPLLIKVVSWMKNHPQPGIYVRQMSIPDIDTKFVERHKLLLAQWLDILLDPSTVAGEHTGVKGFEKRYGFRCKPVLIRFRFLDRELFLNGLSDITLPAEDFRSLAPPAVTVFVTENDINGLTFPPVKRSLVIFGRGYGFEELKGAAWLHEKEIRYWGDIDTHGFAILNQFRSLFPQAESMLMDRDTLLAHRNLWVREHFPVKTGLQYLTNKERTLFEDLAADSYGNAVRLEQEAVSFEWLNAYLRG
jgi:hypothetical protein